MLTIQYVTGDLVQAAVEGRLPNPCIIPHVCNNCGVWEAGFVVPLKEAFPQAFVEYCHDDRIMGTVSWAEVKPGLWVANMLAQTLGGPRPLYYDMLFDCMRAVYRGACRLEATICCPRFGAGLAGGKWEVIEELILDIWINHRIPVQVWSLPGAED